MKLGDYNKVEIMHTNTLNKELRKCFKEINTIKDKIKSAFEVYLSKISLNKDVPAQDPCVECLVKPICESKESIEGGEELETGAFISTWDGKTFSKRQMFEGKICNYKLRAELLNAIKKDVQQDKFVMYAVDRTIEALADTPLKFRPYPFYW